MAELRCGHCSKLGKTGKAVQHDVKKCPAIASNVCHICGGTGHLSGQCMANMSPTCDSDELSSLEDDIVVAARGGSKAPAHTVCKYCKAEGHAIDQCRALKRRTCKRCGTQGHTEKYCTGGASASPKQRGKRDGEAMARGRRSAPRLNDEEVNTFRRLVHWARNRGFETLGSSDPLPRLESRSRWGPRDHVGRHGAQRDGPANDRGTEYDPSRWNGYPHTHEYNPDRSYRQPSSYGGEGAWQSSYSDQRYDRGGGSYERGDERYDPYAYANDGSCRQSSDAHSGGYYDRLHENRSSAYGYERSSYAEPYHPSTYEHRPSTYESRPSTEYDPDRSRRDKPHGMGEPASNPPGSDRSSQQDPCSTPEEGQVDDHMIPTTPPLM